MTTITLTAIRAQAPCHQGWQKLLAHLGKTAADDESLDLLTVLDSNGLDDVLWVLQNTQCDERLSRHFAAWCAEQVLPVFEAVMPGDMRPREAIAAARDDGASNQDRRAAGDAAWDAARAAAGAAWVAACAAAGAAVGTAWDAARAASRAVVEDAVGDAQAKQLRKMLTEGF